MKKTIKKPNFAKKTYGGGRKSVIHKLFDKGLFSSNSRESSQAFKQITGQTDQNSPPYEKVNNATPYTRLQPGHAVYSSSSTFQSQGRHSSSSVGHYLLGGPSSPTPTQPAVQLPGPPPTVQPPYPSTTVQLPGPPPSTHIDYSDINLNGDKPNIEIFIGGGIRNIQTKIKSIYDEANWVGDENNSNMVFLFIQNKAKDKIVSIVRISNESSGDYAFELGFDYTLEDFRRKKLYELLFIARLKYINDKNFKQIYVSYTEDDDLKNFQIRCGMTLIGNNKVELSNGIQYWKLEFHSFKLAAITMVQCNGVYIGDDNNNKGIILTAGHCVVDDSDFTTLVPINNLKNIKATEFTVDTNVDSLKNYFTRETSYKDISYFKVNEKIPNTYIYILSNPEDLPNKTKLSICSSVTYPNWGIDIFNTGFSGIQRNGRGAGSFRAPYSESNIRGLLPQNIHHNYKEYLLPIYYGDTSSPKIVQGDSGGTIGLIFDDINYAIVGLVGSGDRGTAESLSIPVIGQIIADLKRAKINFNLAYYDVVDRKVKKGQKPRETNV